MDGRSAATTYPSPTASLASPRLATPHLASPRLASPCHASPHHASPHLALAHRLCPPLFLALRQVFCGCTGHLERYLLSHGFRLPEKENLADWMIDVVCGLSPMYKPDGEVDTTFVAPVDLFELWEESQRQAVIGQGGGWDEGFVQPLALASKSSKPLTPRLTHGRLMQAFYLMARSFRQHDMPFFLTVCLALFTDGAVFSSLLRSAAPYSYANTLNWTTGGAAGAPLYTLIVGSYCLPLFNSERLNFFREAKSGISSVGYWLAKNAYSTTLLPLLAASYTSAAFLCTRPLQGYLTYFLSYLCAAFYWSGGAMLVASLFSSELSATLVLIFWPLFEPVFEGSRLFNTSPSDCPLSGFTCGRWLHQALFAGELLVLPYQVRNLTIMTDELDRREMSVDTLEDDRVDALLYMLAWGGVLRLLCLVVLLMQKYSEGGSYFAQCIFVLRKFVHACFGRHMAFVLAQTERAGGAYDPDAAEEELFDEDDELETLRIRRSGMAATVSWGANNQSPLLVNSTRGGRNATSARF